MRFVLKLVATLGVVFGILAALVAAWAWFDPASMQMANARDPFGKSPGRFESAFVFAFGLFIAIASARILGGRRGDDEDNDGDDDA